MSLDLVIKNVRVVRPGGNGAEDLDIGVADGKVLVISFTPGDDPCGSGGTSIFHAMDSCTGARPGNSFFVNIDEVVHDAGAGETTIAKTSGDWKEPTGLEFSGRLQPPR